ncbi:MAG: hypothetical protein VKJ04_01055 [Vampirovibrionales bacterium]|nr:hypothetical protein [Vampirovibrionales bacterium]
MSDKDDEHQQPSLQYPNTNSDAAHDASKVISIFQRHKRGEHLHFPVEGGGELIVSPDGFNYVSFWKEKTLSVCSSHPQADPDYLEIAHAKHYLFTFVEAHKEGARVDNYYVPGDRLEEFAKSVETRPGQLIEIKPFIPDSVG